MIRQFLQAEEEITIHDLKSSVCTASIGCKACKMMNQEGSLIAYQENEQIKEVIELVDDPDAPGCKKIVIDYPYKDGIHIQQEQ